MTAPATGGRALALVPDQPNRSIGSAELADDAVRDALRRHLAGERGLVVLAPPGAGKSSLVVKLAAQSSKRLHERCGLVTLTNEQAFDLADRVAREYTGVPVTLFTRADLPIPPHLLAHPTVRVVHEPQRLPTGPSVVIANAPKLRESALTPGHFGTLLFDEAYQVPDYLFLPIAALGERHALVGDPGQISPVVDCDITRWAHDPAGPHVGAPRALLARHADVAVVRLPISRRLVPDTVAVVQPAFYPGLAFGALAEPDERRIAVRDPGRPGGPSDVLASAAHRVLSRLASGASVLQVDLPPSRTPVVADPAVADALVALVASALDYAVVEEAGQAARAIEPETVGVVCAHREQVRAVQERLGDALGLERAARVRVETANRYQGLERDLIFAWHPLTGQPVADGFHLDPGRFCVMLSRHRVACVIVGRAGVEELLDGYVPGPAPVLGAVDDPEYEGWMAHRAVLTRLAASDRVAPW